MARQMGSRISFLVKPETTYGTLATGNFEQVPILDFDPATASDIVDDPVIGFGHRESLDPFRGPRLYKPKVTVPVDLNNIGYWLKACMGLYSVTGSGPYVHVFKAAALSVLPSLSMEAGYPDANAGAGAYFDYAGGAVTKAAFDFSPTGPAKLTLDMVAQSEAQNSSSQGGTPTVQVYAPFNQIQGNVLIGAAGTTAPATAIGNIVGATLNIDNQLEAQPGVGSQGLILGADAGQLKITGDITVRFDTLTLYTDAMAATMVALAFGYKIDTNDQLNIVLPRVALGIASPAIKGPTGIQLKIPFQAARDATALASIIATLTNSVTTY